MRVTQDYVEPDGVQHTGTTLSSPGCAGLTHCGASAGLPLGGLRYATRPRKLPRRLAAPLQPLRVCARLCTDLYAHAARRRTTHDHSHAVAIPRPAPSPEACRAGDGPRRSLRSASLPPPWPYPRQLRGGAGEMSIRVLPLTPAPVRAPVVSGQVTCTALCMRGGSVLAGTAARYFPFVNHNPT